MREYLALLYQGALALRSQVSAGERKDLFQIRLPKFSEVPAAHQVKKDSKLSPIQVFEKAIEKGLEYFPSKIPTIYQLIQSHRNKTLVI